MPYNCLNLQITELKRSAFSITLTDPHRKTITTITEPAQTRFTIIVFLDIIHCLVFYLKHFRDWILSPSSGNSLLSWAQSIGPYLQTLAPTKDI
jgi:hypothetical protein